MKKSVTKSCLKGLGACTLLGFLLAFGHAQLHAASILEGYYETETELNGQDRSWGVSNPRHYFELKYITTPWPDVEGFLRMSAESNRWRYEERYNVAFANEGHVRYRGKNVEAVLFSQQNRFWFSEPLLEIVHPDRVKDDDWGPRAQGLRLDFWGLNKTTGVGFYSQKRNGQDAAAFRVYRPFARNRIILGSTFVNQNFDTLGRSYDRVAAADIELAMGDLVPFLSRFGRVTWVTEVGRNISGWVDDVYQPLTTGLKTELRDVSVGDFYNIFSYQYYETNFYTGLSNREGDDDYKGYYVETNYRIPTKAINLKASRYSYHAFRNRDSAGRLWERVQTLGEIYVEFLRGFTAKAEYRHYRDNNGTYPNFFLEISGENRLAEIRTQLRIKDIDTRYQLEAYGFEMNVNLTEQWKFYSRVMNVNVPTQSRNTVFLQLRYLGWSNGEAFVEFGNPWHSDNLVNDDDFVQWDSNTDVERYVKLFLKLYY
ncbi:MAG: hypothetical protein JSW03_06660 [Candidatus Eiseniibacteriota bacterium]|nr:MAG: hypothetical protein JSW03_06660 [Candidatus Eisenbacteria bacterium]